VLTATGISVIGMMLTLQLHRWHWWPDDDWSFLLVPAFIGSLFLALKHPGTNLLTTFVFLPLVVALLFYAGACIPLAPTM